MNCPNCNAVVDGNPKFCPACGSSFPAAAGSAPPPTDPLIGQTLGGRYRILKLLGEGGMGCVYLGEQQMGTTTRKIAVKTLHPHLSKDDKVLARFEREVETISQLEHPNTILVHDYGKTDDGTLYIVMEFVQGASLADLLEKGGALEPSRVAHIMAQICGSLEEAHGRGIIHRDLKPDNVILTERAGQKDWVKVLDFGIAKRSSEEDKNEQKLTQQGMVLGTPPYMSPEQFTGRPIDVRSDIYSLGVMAYEMLTGRLPFNANTAWEWATQHMTVPPMPIETAPHGANVPPPMRAAIMRALAKSPDDRFATVHQFAEAFAGGGAAAAFTPAPGHAGTAMTPQIGGGGDGRGKTQMGEPLVPPDFGGGSAYGAPPSPAGAPHYGTPAAGNHAFPTPAAIPQPPPGARAQAAAQGGGNRGMLIGGGVLVVVLGLGAVGYSMMHGSGPAAQISIDAGGTSTPTATSDPTAAASGGSTAAPEQPLPDLDNGPKTTPHPSGGGTAPAASKGDAGGAHPTTADAGGGGVKPPPPAPPSVTPEVEAACAKAHQVQTELAQHPNLARDAALVSMLNRSREACLKGGGHL